MQSVRKQKNCSVRIWHSSCLSWVGEDTHETEVLYLIARYLVVRWCRNPQRATQHRLRPQRQLRILQDLFLDQSSIGRLSVGCQNPAGRRRTTRRKRVDQG